MALAERMVALFTGNLRSTGRWNPKSGRMHVEYAPMDEPTMDNHLNGGQGCGVVPIQDNNTCLWAAIDIDNHDSDDDIDIKRIDAIIRQNDLPLVPCRSKSGGVHAYLFLHSPQPAVRVRALMADWAVKLGYPGVEIFPKQAKLINTNDGGKQYGNWINLPYFNAESTDRYAVVDGKRLTLEQFLDYADDIKLANSRLESIILADNPGAPPCIQSMFTKGVEAGQRNEAMYNIGVYFRKKDPATAEGNAVRANALVFMNPLPKGEMMRTITSALRPECSYRCNEDVMKSRCDRSECLRREFGITPDEADHRDKHDSLPTFSDLVKYVTEPVRWEIVIDGVRVYNISTAQLLEWRAMRELIADRLTKIVPVIKPGEWERILQPLMQNARLIETPDDASVNGVVRDRLREFATKADMSNRGDKAEDRKALLRGMPVVQSMDGERCVMFRGQDFVNYLKRTKSEELKGVNLWFAVQELGVMHRKVRIGGTSESCNVWYLPVKVVVQDFAAEPVDFKPEL